MHLHESKGITEEICLLTQQFNIVINANISISLHIR